MSRQQTVLITGGSGFVGTNLVRLLVGSREYRVINLDALTYAANPLSLADLEGRPNYVFIKGNITDRELVSSLLIKYKPAGILHLAAESHVDRSIVNAEDFIQANVLGTYSMLEAARAYWTALPMQQKRLFRFLHVSTDEVFGSLGEQGYFSEETPYAPNSPYAASKAASDHFVRAFHRTYGLPTLTTNCSNNYGPYQFPEKMIPLIILNALSGTALPVYGNGSNIRDWIYVEDHCKALKLAFEKGRPGEAYAIGASNEQRNIDLVNKICSVLDELAPPQEIPSLRERNLQSYSELIRFVNDRPGHDHRYAIDSGKITRGLGWQAEVEFEAGLRRTIEWYLSNPKWVEKASGGSYREWVERNYAWRVQGQIGRDSE
jgi:dTDP-glucose 4,6-dehydratase